VNANPIDEAIRSAVAAALADLLPGAVEAAVMTAASKLQLGDAAEQMLDAGGYGQLVGQTAAAARRAEERGTGFVPAIRLGRSLRWRKRDVLAFLATKRNAT
jgi:hypothetical protein